MNFHHYSVSFVSVHYWTRLHEQFKSTFSEEDGSIMLEHPKNLAAYLDLQVLCSPSPLHGRRYLALREERKHNMKVFSQKHIWESSNEWIIENSQHSEAWGWSLGLFFFPLPPTACLLVSSLLLGTSKRGGVCVGSDRGREKIISQFCILLVTLEKGYVKTEEDNED